MRAWSTIDRWGPGAIALLTLIAVVALGWQYSERIARTEGRYEAIQDQLKSRIELEGSLRQEIQVFQAHCVKLQQLMIQHGIDTPDMPQSKLEGR